MIVINITGNQGSGKTKLAHAILREICGNDLFSLSTKLFSLAEPIKRALAIQESYAMEHHYMTELRKYRTQEGKAELVEFCGKTRRELMIEMTYSKPLEHWWKLSAYKIINHKKRHSEFKVAIIDDAIYPEWHRYCHDNGIHAVLIEISNDFSETINSDYRVFNDKTPECLAKHAKIIVEKWVRDGK
jgi:adenylate kinase family enzyme